MARVSRIHQLRVSIERSRLPKIARAHLVRDPAGGALRLARNGFSAYTESDRLANTTIRGVFESHAGDLYVVSSNQRIHRFDGSGFTADRPNLSEDVAELVNPGLPLQDHTGEWWVPAAPDVSLPQVGRRAGSRGPAQSDLYDA